MTGVAIIGTGVISERHIEAYASLSRPVPDCGIM